MKEKTSSDSGDTSPAMFAKRLQDTSTREGTMIQIKCHVTGNPAPEVAWLFENKRIEACQDKRITMKSGLATLTILSVQMQDAGLYTCEISNGIGSKMSCTCKVAVNEDRTKKFGGKIPHFDKVIKDAQTITGNRARFDCIARGNPKPKITWYHDKVPVLETDNIKFTNDGNNYEMEIMRVSHEDTGTYVCKASNSLGERDCKAQLSTGETGKQNETPKITEPPSFTQVAKNKDIKEGAGVSFEFKFIGSPQPTVVWKFNGKSILRASRVAISQPEPGTARLAINSAKASDAGEYTCVIYNSEGETESSVELTFQGVPNKKNPEMGRDAKKAPVEPDEVSNQKKSDPGKDAKKSGVDQAGTANKKNSDPGKDSKGTTPNQAGAANKRNTDPGKETKATTPNQAGTANKKNTDPGKDLKKPGKEQDVSNNKNLDKGKLDTKKTSGGQDISNNKNLDKGKLDTKKASGGQDMSSNKSLDKGKDTAKKTSGGKGPPHKPPPAPKIDHKSRTLSWEVEAKSSSSNVRYIIEARRKDEKSKEWKQIANNLKEPKYSIKHLDPKTAYVFRVRTESDSGISEPSEEINMSAQNEDDVEDESGSEEGGETKTMERKAPGFLDTTEEVYALDNEDATLECNFTGYPPPKITWMQDDEILHTDDHFIISIDHKEGKTTLEVKGVTYDDIGEYECIAVNDEGYADCRLYLDVAEPPKFVELFESREIPFGYSLRLDCRLDGIPEPDVVWYKDDMPLKQSGRVKYLFEGEDGASLLLENFTRTDCGEYSIRAHNMAGSITHSAMVTAPGVNIEPVRRFRIKTDVKIEDEYHILEELGRGAYGIVHRATDKKTGQERAAKFITIKAGMWEEVRNEIKIMGMLSHKRLIGLYDAYETPKQINMAMELVTGGELFERIVSQDTITEGEAVFFLKQVIDGVSHMHERNVVHLDLKPENILLESADSDNIKVIDFGLARVLKPDEEIQCACGTPEFVAPEVVRRKPITPASDVWSIGVIAYILLSGCSPFMGEDDRQTLVNVRDGDWEFEEDIWDDISEEAKDFIRKVLVVDVGERYTLKQCLEHPWLKFDERRDRGEAKISTERLKNFNSRRKWRKALNAVKSMMRLRRLSSLIRKEEAEEKRQAEEAEKSGGESQDSDSLMSSPSGSQPRTPVTPLEPLVEEETEELEERALPSKDINHNEVVENSLSEKEGSIKHSEGNEKITVNNLENSELQNGPRMSASSENDIEVDIPVDHVYGGIEIFLCNACRHDEDVSMNTSETEVVDLHVTKEKCMPCFCCDLRACHCKLLKKLNSPFIEKSFDCVQCINNSCKNFGNRYMMSKFEGTERGNYVQGWTLQALVDPSKCLEEPVTSMVMHYSEINDTGLQGPPSSEEGGLNISNDGFKIDDVDCSIAEHSTDEINKDLPKVNEKSPTWESDNNQNHKPGHNSLVLRSEPLNGSNSEMFADPASEEDEGKGMYFSGTSGLVKEEESGRICTDDAFELHEKCAPNGEVSPSLVNEPLEEETGTHHAEESKDGQLLVTSNLGKREEWFEKGTITNKKSENFEKCTSDGGIKPSSEDEPSCMENGSVGGNGYDRERDLLLGAARLDEEGAVIANGGGDTSGTQKKGSLSESQPSDTNSDIEVQNDEQETKMTDLVRKRSQRKGGVVQAPKLQGIIEKSLEGDDVYLEDEDIFKQGASFEFLDNVPTKEEKETRRMSNFSILSDDSIDIPDLEAEETLSGRSDILAFDHNRLEARAANRCGSDQPGAPKIMPTKMANLAHMMLKIHQDKKMKKDQPSEDDPAEAEKTLSVPETLEGPPSPIKKRGNQGPIFLGHPKKLFGEETDPQLKFSIFDKYFLLLFTSKVVRFNLCMLFGLILGVIINLSI